MAPWNTIISDTSSPSVASTNVSTTRSEGNDVGVKTGIGIVFALLCFTVITGAFMAKRRHDTHANDTRPWLERLKHIVPCLRRHTQPEATTENNESITLERRSTFPPIASRSSTFDQKLPPYSRQDPLPQSPHVSIIEEDISGEVSRAVTPI